MTPSIASAATQTIATIAFGIVATLISTLTVWQGRRAWRRLYGRQSERNAEADVESQTSIELEARPSSAHIFELPAIPFTDMEDTRLLELPAAFTPSAASTTTTFALA